MSGTREWFEFCIKIGMVYFWSMGGVIGGEGGSEVSCLVLMGVMGVVTVFAVAADKEAVKSYLFESVFFCCGCGCVLMTGSVMVTW